MEFKAISFDPAKIRTDCLVLSVPAKASLSGAARAVDKAMSGQLSRICKSGDIKGKAGTSLLIIEPAGIAAGRLLLVNGGEKALDTPAYNAAINSIATQLAKMPVKQAHLCLEDLQLADGDSDRAAQQCAQLFTEAVYRYTHTHSGKQDTPALRRLNIATTDRKQQIALNKALARGKAFGNGVNTARELGDLPANICNPTYLASQARRLGRRHDKISVKVLSEKQMRELKMGSLLSVTAGTDHPAKLIVMEYKGGRRNAPPVALVGKGVTFDSGGISLKPGAGMDEMKFDMCGAASVFGAVSAAAEMSLPINIVAIVPAVENMPSGKATKPGDVVTSMSGQTIEVLNTDAEGRLILCDALTYAARFKPATVIDIATLTGACVIALGNHATGLYSNDDSLAEDLLASGTATGDRAWRLPLWDEYDQQLKSNFADIANIGGRNAGSVTAACFLARFTKDYRWAHMDIAGTAWNSGSSKGATGRPVALLLEYLCRQAA